MARSNYLFTSESVSEGHPDKVCDRISDEVVDLFFREGPKEGMSPWDIRAACETLATTNRVVIAGEVRGPDAVRERIEDLTRQAIRDIGYAQDGFHWEKAKIDVLLHGKVVEQVIALEYHTDLALGQLGTVLTLHQMNGLLAKPVFTGPLIVEQSQDV